MTERRTASSSTRMRNLRAFAHLHEWVLSLPWVVERPYSVGTRGVRTFAVDCEPLGRHQLWLVTGLRRHLRPNLIDIGVVVPHEAAQSIEVAGWGRTVAPMPEGRVLMRASAEAMAGPQRVEALALSAYCWAMS